MSGTMNNIQQAARRPMHSAGVWGATFYVLWGVMHAMIGIQILVVNMRQSTHAVINTLYQDSHQSTPEHLGPVVGALMNQHGWNLLWFGLFAAVVGVLWNRRNNLAAYWANLAVVSLADIGFIAAILVPGYINVWMGIGGPILWVFAVIFSTLGLNSQRDARQHSVIN